MDSEETANAAGVNLVPLLQQLIDAGIKVNIIAHSMGNRVLLKALEGLAALGGKYQQNSIEHIFMWEAAVPNTALSNDPTKDLSAKRNCYFKDATLPPKKITVLYTQHDEVLKRLYWLANEEYQSDVIEGIIFSNQVNRLHPQPIPHDKVLPALGYSGPDGGSITSLADKLILADLTPWTKGYGLEESHSYMRAPNDIIMTQAYQQYIIGGKGIKQFGVY